MYNDYKLARIAHKDINGETPLSLSVERRRYEAEWLLRKALARNTFELILGENNLTDRLF